jgi:uncharacterized protein YukE
VTISGMTSFLFTDPSELRATAHRISNHADHIRHQAATLAAATATARWFSPSARQFRHRAEDTCLALRRAAGELDDAATALRHHADNVGTVLSAVANGARAAIHDVVDIGTGAVSGAEHLGGSAVHAIFG